MTSIGDGNESRRTTSRKLSRRKFLKIAGAGAAGATLLGVAGCGAGGQASSQTCSGGDVWKQCSGVTLQFISENTPPTAAIAANTKPFTDLTGINVEFAIYPLQALVQKVALDIGAGRGAYQVIYSDPYQVLAPYRRGLANLNKFINDESLPSIPNGLEDFFPTQLVTTGRFGDREELYALPYDNPTMIWMYRNDIFEKYGQQMRQDLGFDPTPSESSTWDQYYRTAEWINENVDEVPYGTGHQAKQHDSLMNDFSNVLWSHGGNYFPGGMKVGRLGQVDPGPCTLDQPKAIEAARFYNELVSGIAHPASVTWDWTGLNNGFTAGEVAMCPNWHEFAGSIADSPIGGDVRYAPLPKSSARSADMFGGSGIAINGAAPEAEQRAAWLFLVWATSPETQVMAMFGEAGGTTPTRQSVWNMPRVEEAKTRPSNAPTMLTAQALTQAWKPENIGLRPKIPSWNPVDVTIYTELSKMLVSGKSPEQAMRDAARAIDEITRTYT